MNYKKIIILPAFFLLTHIIYIGCCKCEDSNKAFYVINNLTVQTRGSGNAIIDTGTVTNVDSVFLNYNFDLNCTAVHKDPFSFLVNSTYACKCNECGLSGLKTKLAGIDITSDSVYNGIAPNTSLNSLFQVYYYNNNPVSLDSLITLMNTGRVYSTRLFTTTKPGNSQGHKFKLKMVFTDGRELTVFSKTIYWI